MRVSTYAPPELPPPESPPEPPELPPEPPEPPPEPPEPPEPPSSSDAFSGSVPAETSSPSLTPPSSVSAS